MIKQKIYFIIIITLLVSSFFSPKYFTINLTDSIPKGIYLLKKPEHLKKGDYIVFPIPENALTYIHGRKYLPKIASNLIKTVGAVHGDKVEINENKIIINDFPYGKISKFDSNGLKLPTLKSEDLFLEKNEILPLAEKDKSFDGRYFGKIKIENISFKAKPVFLF